MSKQEGIAELFYEKLRVSANPGVTLAQFYSALTGKEIGRSEIIKLNILVRTFGKSYAFFSIIDACRKEDLTDFPYGLLYKICKDRLENSIESDATLNAFSSLDRMIEEMKKKSGTIKQITPEKAERLLERKDS